MSFGDAKQSAASASDEWTTPRNLISAIVAEYGPIILDAAATAENTVCPSAYYTKADDSLRNVWTLPAHGPGIVFVNPPFSAPNKRLFTAKAIETAEAGRAVVMVLPVNTRDRWFHALLLHGLRGGAISEREALGEMWPAVLLKTPGRHLWLLEGSVKFGSPLNPKGNGSTGGVVVVAFLPIGRAS